MNLAVTPVQRVVALSVAMAGGAAALAVWGVPNPYGDLGPPTDVPWWGVAAGFFAAEAFVFHLEVRRESHSINLSEIPLVFGLVFLNPLELVLARLVGSLPALVAVRGQRAPYKLGFNGAMFALESVVAALLMRAMLHSALPVTPADWVTVAAAVLFAGFASTIAITLAISFFEGAFRHRMLPQVLRAQGIVAMVGASVATVSVVATWQDPLFAVLMLPAVGGVHAVLRLYGALTRNYANLESLYRFTRGVGRELRLDAVITTVLDEARAVLRSEQAHLVVLDGAEGLEPLHAHVDQDNQLVTAPGTQPRSLWAPLAGPQPRLLRPVDVPDDLAAVLSRWGVREAAAAPIHGERDVVALLVLANRTGATTSFSREDLRLLASLANHAGVTLNNGALLERLGVQARHDTLTGLPNRSAFETAAAEAVADPGRGATVMLLDLDRFKEVNDTLGHQTGDELLVEVARRLATVIGDRGTVARFGGDEFGILLPGVEGEAEVAEVADAVICGLEVPFEHEELYLDVGGSIGVVIAPDHGRDTSTLLQRADVAMYAAKRRQTGWELYTPAFDHHSVRRLALAAELRAAIEEGAIGVHYQPQADLRTGRIVGVEALARWEHPRYGQIPPDEFVMVAEHTGMIRALTHLVLRTALSQVRGWRDRGITLQLAVNLSPNNLLDPDLPDDVVELLREFQLAPDALVLELTETSVMVDFPRTAAQLDRLSAAGVGLAMDDFGVGYSSLANLQRLPIDDLKIDRSFVTDMTIRAQDSLIVRSIVDLGHNLGLRVIAEGVENHGTWERLADLGCDIAQGYLLSRPMPAPALERWLQVSGHSPIVPGTRMSEASRLTEARAPEPARPRRAPGPARPTHPRMPR